MRKFYLKALLVIFVTSVNINYSLVCERCCTTQEYKEKLKTFSDAFENGAADGALDELERDITAIRGTINENIFSFLKDNFVAKKNQLPKATKDNIWENRYRLSIANECFIITELIVLLHTCYKNYSNFLQNNQPEDNDFNIEKFKDYFIKFLKVCDLMMKKALADYKIIKKEEEEDPLSNALNILTNENPFALYNLGPNDYIVDDTLYLRNKIGDLFNIAFGKLISYRLQVIFKKNKNNEDISNDEIKKIDGLTL